MKKVIHPVFSSIQVHKDYHAQNHGWSMNNGKITLHDIAVMIVQIEPIH
jgi:hypothetical protein